MTFPNIYLFYFHQIKGNSTENVSGNVLGNEFFF
ncbi:hypothetical protein CLV98_104315 [Dyadobacter jejuensis]|uniref:Uncharacterized protein n=1 Tax=Dyadobacter jejuensis TaxID=1082580 RepID=A0A316AKY1_9BACT|nr:hypothetical protein CLV98_104315 [Dyadobacter jejuensis]